MSTEKPVRLKRRQLRAWRIFAAHALNALILEDSTHPVANVASMAAGVADAMVVELEARWPERTFDANVVCGHCAHRFDMHDGGGRCEAAAGPGLRCNCAAFGVAT